jgi:zinc/manganese transport system permease protein
MRVKLWDFLFYASFGLVITISVELAGVLMVFSYLVAPAIIALSIASSWPLRVAVACAIGLAASGLGLFSSYQWDLPSGPAVVCSLGLILLLFFVGQKLSQSRSAK